MKPLDLIKSAVAGAAISCATMASAETQLAIGATSAKSGFYGYFVAVANVINENVPEVAAKVVETGATIDNLNRMARGQLDLGLVTTNSLADANSGVGKFDGTPIDSKVLWVYYIAPQSTLVRADAGISTFAELEGQKFNPGLRGSSTEATTDAVFETLGVEVDAFRGGSADARDAVKDNRIVGLTSSSMGDKFSSNQIDIHTFSPVVPLSLTDEQAALVAENHPQLTIVDIPEGAAEGVPAYKTWAFALAASASPELDEETAYQIVKAVLENRDPQTDAMGSTGAVDFAQATIDMSSSPLHPGTIRYLREKGYEIPEHLISPEDR